MGEHVYRWSLIYAFTRMLASLAGWMMILMIPGLFAWMATQNRRELEVPVVCGVVLVILACSLLHSRKYWRRFFDRSPQLELREGYLRAAQLGGEDVLWRDVREIRGTHVVYGDFALLVLSTADGDVELEIAGLDASMRTIVEAAGALWRQRAAG